MMNVGNNGVFAVTPCTRADFIIWDTVIGNVTSSKLWELTPLL